VRSFKGRGLGACPPPPKKLHFEASEDDFPCFLRGIITKVVKLKIQDFVIHFLTFSKQNNTTTSMNSLEMNLYYLNHRLARGPVRAIQPE
jgi:hypothetical protein